MISATNSANGDSSVSIHGQEHETTFISLLNLSPWKVTQRGRGFSDLAGTPDFCFQEAKIYMSIPYLMELSSCGEASSFSATQAIPNILWNQNIHNNVNKILPLVCILNTLHYIPLKTILTCYTRVRLGLPSGFFRSGSMIITKALLLCTMHSICHTHLIILRMSGMS